MHMLPLCKKPGARWYALPLLALLVSCAPGVAPGRGATSAAPLASKTAPERGFAPRVDHHLHLLSASSSEAKLRATPLPDALARLVRDRERGWNDAAALAGLYTEGGALYNAGKKWLTGAKEIASYLARGFTGPYHLKPVTYRIEGTTAQIAGFMVEGDGSNVHFAFFHLGLSKGEEGAWKIATEIELFPGPALDPPLTAEQTVKMLDAAGVERGVVLSDAYYFAAGPEAAPDELEKVRAENDWTAAQVARFPRRLVAFFSANPLRDYALAELERCAASGRFRGLKLHLNGAQLNFHDPAQVAKVRLVMEAANKHRLPMIIHVRSSDTYGREDAQIFLRQLVAAAPDVPIQIAHLWGGEGFAGPALAVYSDAVAAGDPVTRNLYFDISGSWNFSEPEVLREIVASIRKIGLDRILYGSDAPPPQAWHDLLTRLPLTEAEFRAIASNVAPYMRDR